MTALATPPAITSEAALAIARSDAEKAYSGTSHFRIEIQLEDDGWHISFRLKEKLWAGGGPEYVIDADSGTIREKRYYQ